MKWISGFSDDEKVRRKKEWHRWFAWFPVIIGHTKDGRQIKAWLRYVKRRGTHYFYSGHWKYEYAGNIIGDDKNGPYITTP